MSIGISEEHVELARSLREWAASLGGREAARDAEADAGRDVRRRLEGLRRDGRGHDRAARVGRRWRRLGPRPGGRARGVRPRAGARPAARDRGRRRSSRRAAELGDGAAVALALDSATGRGPRRRHAPAARTPTGWSLVPRDAVATPRAGHRPDPPVRTARGRRVAGRRPEPTPSWSAVRPSPWPPPRPPASRAGAWRRRSTTPRCASSSARRSAPSRRSSTCAPRCSRPPRRSPRPRGTSPRRPSGDDEQWAYAADVAEVTCFDGAVAVAKSCIQVLGGIGFTYEHDAHLYLRRALALRALVGDADAAAAAADRPAGRRRTPARATSTSTGRDEPVRARGARRGRADRRAARGRAPRGAGRDRLPDAALAGAVRPRRRRRHPDRHRRGAGPGRRRPDPTS